MVNLLYANGTYLEKMSNNNFEIIEILLVNTGSEDWFYKFEKI